MVVIFTEREIIEFTSTLYNFMIIKFGGGAKTFCGGKGGSSPPAPPLATGLRDYNAIRTVRALLDSNHSHTTLQ